MIAHLNTYTDLELVKWISILEKKSVFFCIKRDLNRFSQGTGTHQSFNKSDVT